MTVRASLLTKILAWFLLSFAVLAAVAAAAMTAHVRRNPESPFAGGPTGRMRAALRWVAGSLRDAPPAEWDQTLAGWSEAYEVDFMLVDDAGRRLAGAKLDLPRRVVDALAERRRFFVRTAAPARNWVAAPAPLAASGGGTTRATLLAVSDPTRRSGLFSDPTPLLWLAAALVALAVLLWIPLVRQLTRPIGQMQAATRQIAQGRFDVRVDQSRSDEIGQLGRAINDMAARLALLVAGQRRLLGDISHELRSPLARLQVALDLLEQTADERQRAYVRDASEEVEQMSNLVGELLAVARAEASPAKVQRQSAALRPIAEQAARREGGDAEVRLDIDPALTALVDPQLLARALANVVRNAVRYAAPAGPVEIAATRRGGEILLEVRDSGPGVPAESLPRLFEPFYRPTTDRDRGRGGAGLGLAIVKTCVEACGGAVGARNLSPRGFAVLMRLAAASSEEGGAGV
jgi:two-component system sensor histidine kinase CpxA